MIQLVTMAEDYLQDKKAWSAVRRVTSTSVHGVNGVELELARLRRAVSLTRAGR